MSLPESTTAKLSEILVPKYNFPSGIPKPLLEQVNQIANKVNIIIDAIANFPNPASIEKIALDLDIPNLPPSVGGFSIPPELSKLTDQVKSLTSQLNDLGGSNILTSTIGSAGGLGGVSALTSTIGSAGGAGGINALTSALGSVGGTPSVPTSIGGATAAIDAAKKSLDKLTKQFDSAKQDLEKAITDATDVISKIKKAPFAAKAQTLEIAIPEISTKNITSILASAIPGGIPSNISSLVPSNLSNVVSSVSNAISTKV